LGERNFPTHPFNQLATKADITIAINTAVALCLGYPCNFFDIVCCKVKELWHPIFTAAHIYQLEPVMSKTRNLLFNLQQAVCHGTSLLTAQLQPPRQQLVAVLMVRESVLPYGKPFVSDLSVTLLPHEFPETCHSLVESTWSGFSISGQFVKFVQLAPNIGMMCIRHLRLFVALALLDIGLHLDTCILKSGDVAMLYPGHYSVAG
jgi:hypothetical protein